MDKDVMKRLLNQAGLPNGEYVVSKSASRNQLDYRMVRERLGEPFFVKPANAGSSIGVKKVRSHSEFESAADNACLFDSKINLRERLKGESLSVLFPERSTDSIVRR